MFVWLAISSIAASGIFGFPGVPGSTRTVPPSVTGVNASTTSDISALKAQIKNLLDYASGDAGAAMSNSKSLNDTSDKRQVTCGLSNSQCNCSGSGCDCSKGQCACPGGCQGSAKVTASIAKDRPKRGDVQEEEEEDDEDSKPQNRTDEIFDDARAAAIDDHFEGTQRIKKRMTDQDKSFEDEDDDDADDEKINATDSKNRPLPRALLDSEKRLYVRSVDVRAKLSKSAKTVYPRSSLKSDEGESQGMDHGADHRDTADRAWELAFQRMPRSAEVQPDYINWDNLYPMNEFRPKREPEMAAKRVSGDGLQKDQIPAQAGNADANESFLAIDDLKRPLLDFVPSDSDESSRRKRETSAGTQNKTRGESTAGTEIKDEPIAAKNADQAKDGKATVPEAAKTGDGADQGKSSIEEITSDSAAPKDVSAGVKSTTLKSEPAVTNKDHGTETEMAQANDAVNVKDSLTGQLVDSDAEKDKNLPSPSSEVKEQKIETRAPEAKQETSSKGTHDPEDTGFGHQAKGAGANKKEKETPDLMSSWGSSHESEKWQEQRRLGDARPEDADFSNLDIRYLGGNDLPIPPVDIHNFNPENMGSRETDPPTTAHSALPLGVLGTESGGAKHSAAWAILVTSVILLIALQH